MSKFGFSNPPPPSFGSMATAYNVGKAGYKLYKAYQEKGPRRGGPRTKKRPRRGTPVRGGPRTVGNPDNTGTKVVSDGKKSSTYQLIEDVAYKRLPGVTLALGRPLPPRDPYSAIKYFLRSRKFMSTAKCWSVSDTACAGHLYCVLRGFTNTGLYESASASSTSGIIPASTSNIAVDALAIPTYTYTYNGPGNYGPKAMMRDAIGDSRGLTNTLVGDVNKVNASIQMTNVPNPTIDYGTFMISEYPVNKYMPIHYDRGFVKVNLRNANSLMVNTELHVLSVTAELAQAWARNNFVTSATATIWYPDVPGLIAYVLDLVQKKHYSGTNPSHGGHVASWPNKTAITEWFANKQLSLKLVSYMEKEGLKFVKTHYTTLVGGQSANVNLKLGGLHVEPWNYSFPSGTDVGFGANPPQYDGPFRIEYPGFYPGCVFTCLRTYGSPALAVGVSTANNPIIPTDEQNVTSVPETKVLMTMEHTEWISAVPSVIKNVDPSYKMYIDDQPNATDFDHVMPYQTNQVIQNPP